MSAEFATLIGVGFGAMTWLLGLSFFAGKLAERVSHHESWRSECRADIEKIYEKIDNIWGLKFGHDKKDA